MGAAQAVRLSALAAHTGQVLSEGLKPPTTKSPGFTVVTALPTSSTTPQNSWPIGVGFVTGAMPR